MSIVDIAIIGSGAASTTTLIELFGKLIDGPPLEERLNITVVDKYAEFWKGIPYGSRSSVNSLTITSVADFIANGKEHDLFFSWFKLNLDELLISYRQAGGIAAEKWIIDNIAELKADAWDKVYVPRYFFGIYMQEKLLGLLNKAEERGLVKVTLIEAEAIDVENGENGLYKVMLEYPDKRSNAITVKKLVVAVGSAPVKNYNKPGVNGLYTYINDIYEPSLDQNLKAIHDTLANTPLTAERNVLLIGSNASSIELVYLLNNRPDIKSVVNKLVSISRKGHMPNSIAEAPLLAYPCPHLDALKTTGGYDIHKLVAAAKKDLEQSIQNETVIVPYVDRIVGYTIELMQALGEEAKKIFFGTYGLQITRLIRRSGPAYKGASETLLQTGLLQLLKGDFEDISTAANGGLLKYTDPDSGRPVVFDRPFRVVINCTGSDDLQISSSRLINNLVNKKLCEVNLSGKGFVANENFEAAPNLYVIGPLLGGNMNKRIYFWHIENLARLLYLAPYLADCLLADI
ncbi:MAG: FAD/NAD(P)-binding protein [Mucilaginibacter sp.]